MKVPVQIQFRGMDRSDALEASAAAHVAKLDEFAPDLMACRVWIELEQKHQQQGRPYSVRLDLTLPGHELVVDRVQREDVYVALRDAFDHMKRQLEDVVRRRRGQEKQHVPEHTGTVVRLDDAGRFGFIRTAEDDEYYFSAENLVDLAFEHLALGQPVRFIAEAGGEGPQARHVTPLRRPPP